MHTQYEQEVALAAQNKRIFSPLGGAQPSPQLHAPAAEWALDVVSKGGVHHRCFCAV
jgi:hypothetical protein